ncbi:MAG: 3-hexulose-6-phosphate synthase [Cyanobacteria bacterium P01_E01_bin.35]
MKLQVAIDLLSLEKAMNLLKDVAPYIDVIEAGTPLIKQEGLKVVEAFKQQYPDKLVFADMKTMDAGELEAEMAFKAGADFVTVLAVANDATIKGAIAAAKKYGKSVTADTVGVNDLEKRASQLEQMGVNFIEVHYGLDQQAQEAASWTILQKIKDEVRVPFAVAGGINVDTIEQIEASGAAIAAFGGAIYNASSPGDAARQIRAKLKS